MKKLYMNSALSLILAALLLALGIVLLPPVTSLGTVILPAFVAALLLLYLIFWLFPAMRRSVGTVRALTMVEFAILALIAIGLVFVQLQIFRQFSVCQIIGIALWLRGCTGVFRGYFIRTASGRHRFPITMLALSVVFVTFGTYLLAKPIFSDETVVYALAVFSIVLALALLVYTLAYAKAPTKKQKKTASKK